MAQQQKLINRWLVVVGSLIIGLLGGLVYAWSIFVRPVCEAYGWGTDQVALMGNVMMALFCGGATVGGNMLPKLGARKTSFIGSMMFGLGIQPDFNVHYLGRLRRPWCRYPVCHWHVRRLGVVP
mgnify:FL=1